MRIVPVMWFVKWLLFAMAFTTWVTGQEDLGPCKKYLNFPSENEVSLLSGKWITLGSTRRVFPCNNIVGSQKSSEVIELDESWMLPGIMGVWKHAVVSEVVTRSGYLEVTRSGFDGVLTSGRLAVGKYGNKLILVQCTYPPWFPLYPMASATILSRDESDNPVNGAREMFERFNVPSSIASFYTVKHDGCDTLPTTSSNTRASSQLLPRNGALERDRSPNWRIRNSPDGNIIF